MSFGAWFPRRQAPEERVEEQLEARGVAAEVEGVLLELLLAGYFGKDDRPDLWERHRRLRSGG
ncbi:hypothetical protein ACIGXM_22750 [Kitasatospora sp. NPDC052896]|uniref:hypothetical protein n=1 Tax=Kitasatospora sp. NPDC052896 TaxID=3364061 RepID=UPI0037C6ABC0